MAIILPPAFQGAGWKKLLFLYFFIFSSFSRIAGREKEFRNLNRGATRWGLKLFWLIMALTIRGVPPFPGFFLKLEILSLLSNVGESFVAFAFLGARGGFLYIYVTFMLSLVPFSGRVKRSSYRDGRFYV